MSVKPSHMLNAGFLLCWFSTLKMEVIRSTETSFRTRTTPHYIPQADNIRRYRCEDLVGIVVRTSNPAYLHFVSSTLIAAWWTSVPTARAVATAHLRRTWTETALQPLRSRLSETGKYHEKNIIQVNSSQYFFVSLFRLVFPLWPLRACRVGVRPVCQRVVSPLSSFHVVNDIFRLCFSSYALRNVL
jgi:hypothetical protein